MKTKFVNFKKDEFSQKIIELSKNNKAPSFKNTIFVIFYNISWI